MPDPSVVKVWPVVLVNTAPASRQMTLAILTPPKYASMPEVPSKLRQRNMKESSYVVDLSTGNVL